MSNKKRINDQIIYLSESEVDKLLKMDKFSSSNRKLNFPNIGESLVMNFTSTDPYEEFIIDYSINYSKNSITLFKRNHQLRGRKFFKLARLDLDGPFHRNPPNKDNKRILVGPRHLHIYTEKYELGFAIELPHEDYDFLKLDDPFETLQSFMEYCNVVKLPQFNHEEL